MAMPSGRRSLGALAEAERERHAESSAAMVVIMIGRKRIRGLEDRLLGRQALAALRVDGEVVIMMAFF